MKRKWKIILGSLVLVVIIIMTVFQVTKPLEAGLLSVKRESIAKTFKEEGIVRAKKESQVYSVYGGKITGVNVMEGDQVKHGDLLVSIDSQELHYQIQSLQAQMRSIEAQKGLQELTIDLETKKLLYEAGVLSKKEYEEAANTVNSDYYPALIAVVKEQINQFNYQLSQRNALSPVSGTVTNLAVKEGMVVTPGAALLSVVSGDTFNIEVYVLTEDASLIEPQMPVNLIQNNKGGNVAFSGVVDRIAPSAVEKLSTLGLIEQRLKVTIIPEIPKNLVLKPGYALDVEFTLGKAENQLVVPKTALFPYHTGDALWVVRNGTAIISSVKKGFENDRNVAISEGLEEGALVILNPKLAGLKEGKKIKAL
ncbi:MAG: Nickel and cobalt resistance protein CnrB [Candidatus Dichloromethanomonas elyunquensis]|nr:MAG: Nickel and cobalt resistance protein CnrB [Candidatus Dichloromethanomonas elyunquensis]